MATRPSDVRGASPPPRPFRPRFALGTLMLVAFVCCMTAAGARYLMLQGRPGPGQGRALQVLLVLMLPMLVVISVNLVRLAVLALGRRRPRGRPR